MPYVDFDKVYENIHVGAFPVDGGRLVHPPGIEVVAFCAKEMQPTNDEIERAGIHGLKVPLDDAKITPDEIKAARRAAALLSRHAEPMLVTCQMGVNRSALIAALVIVIRSGKPGWWAKEVVRVHRKPRAYGWRVLGNQSFEAFLDSIKGPKDLV